MSYTHAQGKLEADARLNLVDKHGNIIARLACTTGKYESEELNARRLAACWNACEKVSTEDLDALTSPGDVSWAMTIDMLVRERDHFQALAKDNGSVIVKTACDLGAMRAQRDELLAALKACHDALQRIREAGGKSTSAEIVAEKAIAKIEGHAS